MMQRRQFLQAAGTGGGLFLMGQNGWAQEKTPPLPPVPSKKRRVLVWSEGTAPKSVYPDDIRGAVAQSLAKLRNYDVTTATLTDPDQGVSEETLAQTDVLIWWGHQKHGDVKDATVARVVKRIKEGGMGFVALHSSHFSKPLKAVLGDTGAWKEYTNDGKPEQFHVVLPHHPIARGVRDFTFPKEERYEEPFVVPVPEAVPFDALYEATGTRARQGLCWTRGMGRVFYFRPGHEEYPIYFMPEVRRILRNAVCWAAHDEAGIWEDCDPFAANARATKEPPLAEILTRIGYGGTDITRPGEIAAPQFVKAGVGTVKTYPVASFGLIKDLTAGWYSEPATAVETPNFAPLWKVEAPFNKQDKPPVAKGAVLEFEPVAPPFGLYVSTSGFVSEMVCTGDKHNAAIKRFGGKAIRKARVYAAVTSDYVPVPNAYIIGWEYSTNDDFQDIVTMIENVRPA